MKYFFGDEISEYENTLLNSLIKEYKPEVVIANGDREAVVVKAMIAMATEAGLDVIAEGIETPASLAVSSSAGINAPALSSCKYSAL